MSQARAMTPKQEGTKSQGQKFTKDDNDNITGVKVKDDEDPEFLELSKLRCTGAPTEEIASREKAKQERQKRRSERSADYPGLAFGSAGSEVTMKFNIIKNELHNIMKSQLKRVDGEVTAMSKRIKALDEKLEKSEQLIRTATTALAEAVQLELESRKECEEDKEEEDALTQFDAQMKLLEGKLAQARILADEARQLDLSGVWKKNETAATRPK